MTPRWELAAELADTREQTTVRQSTCAKRDRRERDETVARAFSEDYGLYLRLLASVCPESTIDREFHAANVCLTVTAFKHSTADAPPVCVGSGRVGKEECCR